MALLTWAQCFRSHSTGAVLATGRPQRCLLSVVGSSFHAAARSTQCGNEVHTGMKPRCVREFPVRCIVKLLMQSTLRMTASQ